MRKVVMGLAALGAIGTLLYFAMPDDKMVAPEEIKKKKADGRMTDEERVAYLNEHVQLQELKLAPDTEPNSEKVVPGLLRITGKVMNQGERTVEEAHLMVLPKNADGKIVSSYIDHVLAKGPLKPGELRPFLFRVPAKPDYDGSFDHKWR